MVAAAGAHSPALANYVARTTAALDTMESLIDDDKRGPMLVELIESARRDVFLRTAVGKDISHGDSAGARSAVVANNPVPKPPFWGAHVRRDIPIAEVLALLDIEELFRLQWGGRGSGPAMGESRARGISAHARATFRERRARAVARAADRVRLLPRAVERQRPHRV